MKFEKYYKLTLTKINEEIEKDNITISNKVPLFESPIYHEAEFFNHLNDIKTNHPFALERKADGIFVSKVNINGQMYGLYRSVYDNYLWDFFIHGQSTHELIYAFIKYKAEESIMKIGGLWQYESTIGLVRGLIGSYYSKYFTILESNSITNSKGKKFYQKLARDYIQNGKKVTIDIKGTEIPYNIDNADSYWQSSIDALSYDKKLRFYL